MNTETNFMSFENLTKLIEEHKKETHPYKRYEFDSTSYTLLLISINNLIKENQDLKKQVEEINKMIEKCGFVNIEQVMLNYCGLLNQQKEFISYLENEIKSINPEYDIEEVYRVYGYEVMLNYTTLVEILQKCRSIMGVSDENKADI